VSIRTRVIGIGGHQPLLHREHEIVRGVKSRRRQRRICSPEPELERTDRFAQLLGSIDLVIKPKALDVIEQRV